MKQLRSQSRLGPRSRAAHCKVALAIEWLEPRQMMSAATRTLTPVLTDGPIRNVGVVKNRPASWYTATGKSTAIAKAVAAEAVASRGSATSDIVPPGTAVTTNAAGLPLLTSRSDGAGLKIFLDFDGYGTDLPFSKDADTTTFNAEEQVIIYDCWRDIVSFFAPLNVNVTTVQPPIGGSNPDFAWQRISNSISGGAAYVGAINNSSSNGWNQGSNAYDRHSGIAHEIGHQLGLSHQSEYDASGNKATEYSDGFDNRHRPIMGVDYDENVRDWFFGRNSDDPTHLQDDWAIMANTIKSRVGGDGYRPDVVGDTIGSAALMPASGITAGIIERIDDADVYKFTSTGGTYQIAATPTFESSVSPKLELLDASGNLIASRDDADRRNTNNNAQEFSLNLAAGTYYARITSSGDYTEQGEYLVTAAPLPSGWTSQDIGASTIYRAGTAAFDPTANTLTQLGGGNDIWSTTDEFRFTSTTLTGDGSITARIDSLDNVDVNSKAGVMIRSTTAANSAHVYVGIKPSGQLDPIVRTTAGGTAFTLNNPAGVTAPWVRLTRTGNLFTIERSADGVSWTTYGTQSVTMGSAVQIGFATNSRATRAQAYASFSNISVTGTLGAVAPTYNALPAPTNLIVAPVAGATTSITMNWSAVADATGYGIERSFDGVNFTLWSTVAAGMTTFTDNNPFGSMRYYYRISAMAAGTSLRSVPSTVVSVVNKPAAPKDPSTDYAVPLIQLNDTQILLNWTDVQGDNGYRIERSTNGGAFIQIATTPRNYNGYNDSGLTPATQYTYRVTPITSVGDGVAPSWTASGKTALSAPANFRVSARTPTSLTLAWSDLTGESGYRLERTVDNTTWTTVANLGANVLTYTDSNGLAPLTRYYYRLRALDSSSLPGVAKSAFAATPASTALPATWTDADIGAVPGAGAGAGSIGGTWTVIGAGNDIWNTADQFNYLSRPVQGDGSIVARLISLDQQDTYTKGGVMFRASSAADSAYVFMHYSSGPGLQFEYRDSSGAGSNNGFILASDARYLRLTRVGNLFTASYSSDGSTWTVAATRTVAMPASATMGLAATSHNTTRLTLATFDNVTTTGAGVNTAPTIVTAAAATPVGSGTTSTLTVSAADDGGAANLSYLWSVVSKPSTAANPTFSAENTNAASTTLATFSAAGTYVLRVTVKDAQGLTVTSDVSVTVALRVISSAYQYDTAQPQLVVQFNGDITSTLGQGDLVLTNTTTGNTISASMIAGSFNAATNTATFTFPASVTLPDGNYTAKIVAGSVAEPSGVALATDYSTTFFVLAGDANHDGHVNFDDLIILAQNYNQTGKTFSQGNFNYDAAGTVNFDDLILLAQRYNLTLAPAFVAPASVEASVEPGVTAKKKPSAYSATVID